ncbi:hypothetical protein IG631_11452 [Alternaria alternata]|nr:hypothetical protein IG631_11452 [Alternaria alternata]
MVETLLISSSLYTRTWYRFAFIGQVAKQFSNLRMKGDLYLYEMHPPWRTSRILFASHVAKNGMLPVICSKSILREQYLRFLNTARSGNPFLLHQTTLTPFLSPTRPRLGETFSNYSGSSPSNPEGFRCSGFRRTRELPATNASIRRLAWPLSRRRIWRTSLSPDLGWHSQDIRYRLGT